MNKGQIRIREYDYSFEYHEYCQSNPLQHNEQSPIIEGYFPKENSKKNMAIKKINTTLTILLLTFLFLTAIGYYFATADEMVLNDLSRQTVILNDENADLQNKVDKLKSFSNVDMTMQKNNLLRKAQTVLEIPAISSAMVSGKQISRRKPFSWAIGY